MNRQEALEWATDFMERAKIFDGASLTPAAKLSILSEFADSIVTPDPPPRKQFLDESCAGFIQACTLKMKTAGDRTYRNLLKQAVDQHIWFLSGMSPANTPHPDHDVPGDPNTVSVDDEKDEPAIATSSARKKY